jgi:hypothetical protein
MASEIERGFHDGLKLGRKIVGFPFMLLGAVMMLVGLVIMRWAFIFNRWSTAEGDEEIAQLLRDWAADG